VVGIEFVRDVRMHKAGLFLFFLTACGGGSGAPDAAPPDAAADVDTIDSSDAAPAPSLTESGPLILKGASNVTYSLLHITSTSGPCVRIENGAHVTIRASDIGPCAGNAVEVAGGDSITIEDSYLHPDHASQDQDTADGVFATGTSNLALSGNVIAFGEANIEVSTSQHVKVIGNFLLNPQNGAAGSRGQNFQSWGSTSDVLVQGNYALSSTDSKYAHPENQEDSINFGQTDQIVVKNNYVTGGHSDSGCGIIADDAANGVQFLANVLVDTGQCGISIADGTDQLVDGNQIINSTPTPNGGNTGLVVWKQYTDPCGPVTISNNVSSELKPDLTTESGYWNGGGCGTVTLTNNTFDSAARAMLTPVATKLPPPLIPPIPVSCSATSPWTNQTTARCWK
jgi:hypothetical protein